MTAIAYNGHRQARISRVGYVYQQPLDQLLRGEFAEITVSNPLTLPTAVRSRQGRRRKAPTKRDPAAVSAFLAKVATGMYLSVTSRRDAAVRLGMDVREMYRIAPDAMKAASAAIQARKAAKRAAKAESRLQDLETLLRAVSATLAAKRSKVTRRVVCDELAKCGYQVTWAESKHVLALAKHYAALAEADLNQLQSAASGNS